MKKVLFIGLTYYKIQDEKGSSYLERKFKGLNEKVQSFVLARGGVFHQTIWGTEFYLLEPDIFFWPSAFFVALYVCLKENIDVIITETPLLDGFIGTIVAKILGKELIVEIHGDWEEAPFLVKKRSFAGFKKKIVPFLAKFSLRSADKVRVISGFTKKKARDIVGDKKPIFVFPAFTDLDIFFKEQDTSFENFILFVGVLEKVKGIEYLIEAFSKIHNEFPKFTLKIVGKGSQKGNLIKLADQYGVDGKVDFTGRLSLKQTKDIMKRCYCLILPSLSEGLGRVLIEAAALGKPLVGSNVGGIPDIIEDGYNGFLFGKENPEELARKLARLMEDEELSKEMGRRGKEFVMQKFSNKNYIQDYISMIGEESK